jgi:DNA-binding transcriptional LysR family regulator
LKRVLVDWSITMPGLHLYYPSRRHVQPALRAFIDCLLDRPRPRHAPETLRQML